MRNLSSVGFKILLDIFASCPKPPKVKEVPYEFRNRLVGDSKLGGQAVKRSGREAVSARAARIVVPHAADVDRGSI